MSKNDDCEYEATKGFELGIVMGWDHASGHVMNKAMQAFRRHDNKPALELQALASELSAQSKSLREAYDKKYPMRNRK